MIHDAEALEIIESKVRELELRVYGENSPSSLNGVAVIDSLLKDNTLLTTAISGLDKPLFKRLRELNHYLEIGPITDDPTGLMTKLNVILVMENEYRKSIGLLEKVKEAESVLDDNNVKNAEALKTGLNDLIVNHLSNRERLDQMKS